MRQSQLMMCNDSSTAGKPLSARRRLPGTPGHTQKTVKLRITNVRPAVVHAMRIANAMGKAGKFLRMYLMHSGRAELRVLFRILSCARGLVVLRTSKDYDF